MIFVSTIQNLNKYTKYFQEQKNMYSQIMMNKLIINAETLIKELLDAYPNTAEVFIKRNMVCVGCEAEEFHTLNDAAVNYNIELESLIAEIEKTAHI